MAIGDIYIRSNSSDNTTVLPNGGVPVDLEWDNESVIQGSAATYNSGVFTLSSGKYLVLYSESFFTNDTTNNDRFELQGELIVTGAQGNGGFCQDYIRKTSGQQEVYMGSSMLIDVASIATFTTRFYRSDTSTVSPCNRVSGFGSVIVLQIDDLDNLGLYKATASQNLNLTESTIAFNSNLLEDAAFSRVGNAITIADAGRYYITYSLQCSQTGTGREDVVGRLTNNGTEIAASQSYSYARGSDGAKFSALTWQGIVDLPANSSIELKCAIPWSATFVIPADNATIHFWKIPSAGDVAMLGATSGDYNKSGNFTFDTVDYIDSSRFSATNNSSDITLLGESDFCLVFSTFHQDAPDSPQRAYPLITVRSNNVASTTACAGVYHRASGSGVCAVTVGDIVPIEQNNSMQILTNPSATSGSLNADQSQFSVLSLTSLYRSYSFPPLVNSINDETISLTQTGLTIQGARFGPNQGGGGVYISNSKDRSSSVTQTVTSWSDTQITFDGTDLITLTQGQAYFYIISSSGQSSNLLPISVGLTSYAAVIEQSEPDHFWKLDGDYDDSISTNNMTVTPTGVNGFASVPLVDGTTLSWRNQNGKREVPNSNFMNQQAETTRTMGGWIRLGGIQKQLSCAYEEGGSVNNLAFFVGVGNVLIAQLADTGDDNIQAFSDFSLEPNRSYHIAFKFDYNTSTDRNFMLYIDGVRQTASQGNPMAATDLDGHPGDIVFGAAQGNLEVGGTDVAFAYQEDTYFAYWASWTKFLSDDKMEEVFKRGASPTHVITNGTEENMQAQLDTLANSTFANDSLTIRIANVSGTLNLSGDNLTFNPLSSLYLEWRGTGTLNWTNSNGTNLVIDKCFATEDGIINILNPVVLTLNTLQVNTEVRVYDSSTGVEVGAVENSTTSESFDLLGISSVDIVLVSIDYKYLKLSNVDTTSNVSLPIQQRFDRNYTNP